MKLWKQGENSYIDLTEFKSSNTQVEVNEELPITIVVGKMLKMPKSYIDVRGAITADYQNYLEKAWIETLRNKYVVEINQEVLAGAYEDFAEEYRKVHGDDVSDLDILVAAKDLYENTGSGAGLDDYELDFYKQMDLMKDTYEALGYDNAWEGIEESIQLIQAKEITPHEGYKNYSNSSSGSSNNNQQTQQSTRTSNRYTQQNNPNSSGQMDDISDILDDLNNRRNN